MIPASELFYILHQLPEIIKPEQVCKQKYFGGKPHFSLISAFRELVCSSAQVCKVLSKSPHLEAERMPRETKKKCTIFGSLSIYVE